ncbi:hypothetical protein SACS_1316 [Parasaccharibacter apium]|uniref:Uncharacterized protein n=1 Tax=Parasaccharibacter apium TaxID=1510841 RepID=A0A7U7J158_9PROT|nr:hypothetical protein SACS_1316 [Parasaccharibacter apium]
MWYECVLVRMGGQKRGVTMPRFSGRAGLLYMSGFFGHERGNTACPNGCPLAGIKG